MVSVASKLSPADRQLAARLLREVLGLPAKPYRSLVAPAPQIEGKRFKLTRTQIRKLRARCTMVLGAIRAGKPVTTFDLVQFRIQPPPSYWRDVYSECWYKGSKPVVTVIEDEDYA